MQTTSTDFRTILKEYWGYDDFRGIQHEIIESICAGRDTLGLMPTGGGKSITFQVPALASKGICIVITPLIALMKDQVEHLRRKGIKATAVYMGMSHEKVVTTLENCIFGDYKLLYISPERIGSELFQAKLAHMNVSFICVDEAHCISQWGYDFRQSYLQIKQIRKMVPHAPILALTATATPDVIKDIQQQLEFREENVFKMSFERKNLAYIIQKAENKEDSVRRLLRDHDGSVIIYVRNRQLTKELADKLNEWGYSATHYHAGLSDTEKDNKQTKWQSDKIRIMVSTNAFGMGIDKPDVRLVIHYGVPDAIESYFQEAGRAGRDGQPSKAILLYNAKDIKTLKRRVSETYPEQEEMRTLYEEVCCYLQVATGFGQGIRREFNIIDFCRKFHHFPTFVESSLQLLTKAGYIEYTDSDEGTSRLMINYTREELYHIQENNHETDLILQSLFRQYPGLFSRYVNIDEVYIANATGLTTEKVYNELKMLTHQHILTYIPRKNIPHITFTRERREAKNIVFPQEIYEKRKANMQQRIDAMTEYVTQDDTCRNRFLLKYFGERISDDCGQCDICVDNAKVKHPASILIHRISNFITGKQDEEDKRYEEEVHRTKDALIKQIEEAGSIHPFMLNLDDLDPEIAKEVIQQMSDDKEITTDSTFRISLRKK